MRPKRIIKSKTLTEDEKIRKSLKTMNVVLIVIGIYLFLFTGCMIHLYIKTGGIPDTLVTCVFAACTGELGVMGWIKSTKDKYIKRAEKLEDIALGLKPKPAQLNDFMEDAGDGNNE